MTSPIIIDRPGWNKHCTTTVPYGVWEVWEHKDGGSINFNPDPRINRICAVRYDDNGIEYDEKTFEPVAENLEAALDWAEWKNT